MAEPETDPSTASSPASTNASDEPHTPNPHSSNSQKKAKAARTPLSETQKNTNHKDAENKRRNAIREQFTQLSALVPQTAGHAKSELFMLERTIDFFREQVNENRDLVTAIEKHGIPVEDSLRQKDHHYGGPRFKQDNLQDFETARAKRIASSGLNGARDADKEDE